MSDIVFEHIPLIDSTNAELSRRISAGAIRGVVCLSANEQTAGRGRRGRSWLNTDGALMMSICRDVSSFAPNDLPLISIASALGVHDALSELLPCCVIKWPNDIICIDSAAPEKLCGILSELVFSPNSIPFAVIGIGLNANCAAVPSGLLMNASSLKIKLGRDVDTEILKKRIASAVLGRLKEVSCGISPIDEYSRRCATLGSLCCASDLSGRIVAEGIASRLLSDGRLVISAAETDGSVRETIIDASDVSIRKSESKL